MVESHYQTGADSCACGRLWPCDTLTRALAGLTQHEHPALKRTSYCAILKCDEDWYVTPISDVEASKARRGVGSGAYSGMESVIERVIRTSVYSEVRDYVRANIRIVSVLDDTQTIVISQKTIYEVSGDELAEKARAQKLRSKPPEPYRDPRCIEMSAMNGAGVGAHDVKCNCSVLIKPETPEELAELRAMSQEDLAKLRADRGYTTAGEIEAAKLRKMRGE